MSSVPPSMHGADLDDVEVSSAFSFSDFDGDDHLVVEVLSSHHSSTTLSDDYDFVDEPVHENDGATTDDGL